MDEPRPPNWNPATVFADLRTGSGPTDSFEIAWLLEEAEFTQSTTDETDWPFREYKHGPSRAKVWLQMDRPIGAVQAKAIAEIIDMVWSPEPNGERVR